MSLINDLTNLSVENMTFEIIDKLALRGAFPIMNDGKLAGFDDEDGIPLVMYK